jgi:HD-like signal output (HDOD) protein
MKRILFVDDESKILDGIRRMLYANRSSWDMQFANSGEAALTACEAGAFDVVVSDLRMPGMDGATLLGHIRDRFPSTARVVLSGYSEVALGSRALPVAHRFLAKPCCESELRTTVERLFILQDLVDSPAIRNIVGAVSELPSLSTTYIQLRRVVSDENTSIGQVAEIIQQDVAMSAKVLQLTNSAFFGLAQKVTNLSSAVSYLGMETIKNLALTSEAFKAFGTSSRIPQSILDSIQRHALLTAAIAVKLPVERGHRDITAVAAMLHDIGVLFLASKMPDAFCSTLSRLKERGCRRFEAEEELLGTSHAEIGAYLLGLWGIPNLVVEAIAHHHHPTRIQHSEFDCTVAV